MRSHSHACHCTKLIPKVSICPSPQNRYRRAPLAARPSTWSCSLRRALRVMACSFRASESCARSSATSRVSFRTAPLSPSAPMTPPPPLSALTLDRLIRSSATSRTSFRNAASLASSFLAADVPAAIPVAPLLVTSAGLEASRLGVAVAWVAFLFPSAPRSTANGRSVGFTRGSLWGVGAAELCEIMRRSTPGTSLAGRVAALLVRIDDGLTARGSELPHLPLPLLLPSAFVL